MSALNDIAKIKKHKLKSFQKEINAIRSGFLGDKTIQEWKELPDSERKLKITVFLCMAMIPEKDLERMVKILNPWWEPYQKAAKLLAVILVLFFSYQLTTFILAKRVYPKVFEYDASFTDGTVKRFGLFNNSSMIRKETDSGTILIDAGIIDWIVMKNKSTSFDSTKWTTDKELNEDLENFYRGFLGNALMSGELKNVSLSIESIYQTSVMVAGIKNLKMDLYVPAKLSNDHSPFFKFPYEDKISFFFSVTEGSRYWNIKIDFKDGKPIKWGQILFPPMYQQDNQQKVVWDRDQKLFRPALKKIFKDLNNQASSNYFIYKLDTSIAEQ